MRRSGGGTTGRPWPRGAAGAVRVVALATAVAVSGAVGEARVRAQAPLPGSAPIGATMGATPGATPGATTTGATIGAAPVDPAAASSTPVDEAEVLAVARGLNCPICQGRNLVECPLPVCAEMRDEIRARLAAGADRAAIIQHFVDYYGPAVRNTPPMSGLLGLAWWVPLGLLVGGAWLVARIVRPGAGSGVAMATGQGDIESPYAAALERMVADRERGETP